MIFYRRWMRLFLMKVGLALEIVFIWLWSYEIIAEWQNWQEKMKGEQFYWNGKEQGMIRWELVDIQKSSNVGECLLDHRLAGLKFVGFALLYELCLLWIEDLKFLQLTFLTFSLLKALLDKLTLCLSSSFFSQFLNLFRRKVVVLRSTVAI